MFFVLEEEMLVAKLEEPEFCWGKKKGRIGNNEGVQLYESFAYDGGCYALNDFVYLYDAQRDHPQIGKILGIWETASKSKIIKVRWLFRASEIAYWLRMHNVKAMENEVFLATGQGVGLEDNADLEAIIGKCRVVCISRETWSSTEYSKNADYVLYRTFDVGNYIISENMDDVVGAFNQVYVPSDSPKNKRNDYSKKDSIYSDVRPSKASKVEELPVKKRKSAEESMNAETKGIFMNDPNDVKISSGNKIDNVLLSSKGVKRPKAFHQSPTVVTQQPGIAISDDKKGNIPLSSKSVISSQEMSKVGRIYEVTRRPITEKGKWYKYNPWEEENMRCAHDEKRMVLLENLDPEYTSGEVEDLLWSAFHINCSAKMVQHAAFQDYGRALIILRRLEAAEWVVRELMVGCLVISGKRALTGSIINLPILKLNQKMSKFVGHLSIDKNKLKRVQKDAQSTSHHSQANTIEYELSLGWCLLQARHDLARKRLFKNQGTELSKLMGNLRLNMRSNMYGLLFTRTKKR